jgi:hypothetical protein
VVNGTRNYLALARTATAVAAAVGQPVAFAQCGFKHGFAILRMENMAAGPEGDLSGHL